MSDMIPEPSSSESTRKKLDEHPVIGKLAAIARGEEDDEAAAKFALRRRALQKLREKEFTDS